MEQSEAQALADDLARLGPTEAFNSGLELLRAGYAEILLPVARRCVERNRADARLAQLYGLAARDACESGQALSAFTHAARLAPTNALIAHSHARTTFEAGLPASALFQRAAELAPNDGSVLMGFAAALVAEHRAQDAVDYLQSILSRNPLWTDGHRSLAHLRGQMGIDALATLNAALASHPRQQELHRLRVATLLEGRRHADAEKALAEARKALGDANWINLLAGHVASEMGQTTQADALLAMVPPSTTSNDLALQARHALRAGRPAQAVALLESQIGVDPDPVIWPYLSLAWRLTDDVRWTWLEGNDDLVGVYDLGERIGGIEGLADHLRTLHFATEEPLGQSVRGGTQTDGNLLLRTEAPIRELKSILLETVAAHVQRLPSARANHPTLIEKRSPRRIAGSWSVRLQDRGFHSDHIHQMGWLSSALYVVVPETMATADASPLQTSDPNSHSGWLSLGECREVVPGLEPVRLVEPRPGRLVLFPSTMWHGTRPFPSGERMTVAFDIAVPRQS